MEDPRKIGRTSALPYLVDVASPENWSNDYDEKNLANIAQLRAAFLEPNQISMRFLFNSDLMTASCRNDRTGPRAAWPRVAHARQCWRHSPFQSSCYATKLAVLYVWLIIQILQLFSRWESFGFGSFVNQPRDSACSLTGSFAIKYCSVYEACDQSVTSTAHVFVFLISLPVDGISLPDCVRIRSDHCFCMLDADKILLFIKYFMTTASLSKNQWTTELYAILR